MTGNGNGHYDPCACRLLIVRMLWDAMVDYVRRVDERHEHAKDFLFSSAGGWYLFECLGVEPTAALDAIEAKRKDFKRMALMAYIDPLYEKKLLDWWAEWYGVGFPSTA